MTRRLTTGDVEGVFGLIPTPATPDADEPTAEETVDHEEAARATRALEAAGVDALMLTGTFGEGHALTDAEWRGFTETVCGAAEDVLVVAGPTTLDTRTTIRRARFARDAGAAGILLGRPMWCELSPEATVRFYRDVAAAVPELGVVAYENPGAFKRPIASWRELAETEGVVAAKYVGLGPGYWEAVRQVEEAAGDLAVVQMDAYWLAARSWFDGVPDAVWSSSVACGPEPTVALYEAVTAGDHERARELTAGMAHAFETFFPDGDMGQFARHNVGIEKARIDEAGFMHAGPCRPPNHVTPERYLEGAREAGRRWAALAASVGDR